jgi:hypothetical protein
MTASIMGDSPAMAAPASSSPFQRTDERLIYAECSPVGFRVMQQKGILGRPSKSSWT